MRFWAFRSRAITAISKGARRNDRRASNCHRERAADAGSRTILIGEAYQRPPPPGPFSTFIANKGTYTNQRLGDPSGPLGDPWAPWVTQGAPRRHPIPDPIPMSAEGRKLKEAARRNNRRALGRFSQLPRANYQEPLLSSFFCQRSRPKAPSSPEPNSMFYHLFALVSSKKSAKNAAVNSKLSDATGWSRHLCLVTTFFDNRIR